MTLLLMAVLVVADDCTPRSPPTISSSRTYVVHAGETLERIAQRFASTSAEVTAMNPEIDWAALTPGQEYRVTLERLPPVGLTEGLVVNVPERSIYWVVDGRVSAFFPVAVGRGPTTRPREAWPTKPGQYVIKDKLRDPTWYVPASIQREQARLGETVETIVPPGSHNPLGHLAMHTTGPFVIHETPERSSVGRFASHGCVRLLSEDMRQLFDGIEVGTPVTVLYEDIKVAATLDGHVLVEINPDHYHLMGEQLPRARAMIAVLNVDAKIDDGLLQAAIERSGGRVVDVTDVCAAATVRVVGALP